jgi:hypothetical protein
MGGRRARWFCSAWLLAVVPAVADTKEGVKPGKKGQVTFSSEVRVGDLLLKQGEYTVQCVPAESCDSPAHQAAPTKAAMPR